MDLAWAGEVTAPTREGRGASKRGEGGTLLGGLFLVLPDKLKTSLPAIHSEEASSFLHGGLQCWEEIGFWEVGPPGALKEGEPARMERERP